ncbi:MAG TPA: glycosyltransferase family 39 protein [Tepidisphaeraceae bacterium]
MTQIQAIHQQQWGGKEPAPPDRRTQQQFRLVLIALAILSALVFWYATRWGIGLSPDSGFYIKSARHMLGREHVDPAQTREMSSHFPPAYPLLLAGPSIFGADPQTMARPINLLLFGASAMLVATIVHQITRANLAAFLAGLFLVFLPDSLAMYATALSEGLFITLLLATFLFLNQYARSPSVNRLLAAGGFGASMILARYAGVAIVPAGAIFILWTSRTRRLQRALLFVAVALAPLLLVALINKILWGSSVNRTSAFHPLTTHHVRDFALTAAQWLLPQQLSKTKLIVFGIFITLAGLTAVVLALNSRTPSATIAALFVCCYLATLAASISFVDYHTPVDERLLLPVAIALIPVMARAAQHLPSRLALSIALIVTVVTARGVGHARTLHRDGIGYASPAWEQSELIQAIHQQPRDQVIYSNAADVVYLVARRQAFPLPAKVIPTSTRPNPDFENQMIQMAQQLTQHGAKLFYFKRFESKRPYYPSETDLRAHRFTESARFKDGSIYTVTGS